MLITKNTTLEGLKQWLKILKMFNQATDHDMKDFTELK